jgi:hypothetical protein
VSVLPIVKAIGVMISPLMQLKAEMKKYGHRISFDTRFAV